MTQHDPLRPERKEGEPGTDLSRFENEVERLRQSPTPTRRAPRSDNLFTTGEPLMGIFNRARDIFAANFSDLLDKADDPSKMIRMIILEMEETLVEVRASAARTIADQKEMHRHTVKLDRLQADWGEKAQLALSKDREDLARAALVEKKRAADMAGQLTEEIKVLDDALRAYEVDIEKLQVRLREARSRQSAIAARLESAENRVKLRSLMTNERVDDALDRFDQLERRVDYAEGRADALAIEGDKKPSLSDEIAALEGADKIDSELEEMKRALGKGAPDENAKPKD
ncbi:MAG: phage shock protein PspA [Alteripontixanthobacter sp.]